MALVCIAGDARRSESYARALGGEKAALLLTDPPYCLLTRRRKGGELRDPKGRKIERRPAVRFETVRDYRAFTAAWMETAVTHVRPGAPLVIWTNFLGKEPILETAAGLGYRHLEGEFRWAKRTTPKDGNELLLRVYEVALVLWREPPPALSAAALPKVWAVVAGYDDDGEAAAFGSHPHHKPFGVLEPLVRTYSRVGELVLDPFAGSGSVPAAAVTLGRNVACIELEAEWAALTTRRLQGAVAP
ncbi:MAG: site-specific DNA-methyltransferase [Deltaproteobacteria bacterium]|nr:site-specific DNA-methyltransferase [Deltaproteobacteria bacterium]